MFFTLLKSLTYLRLNLIKEDHIMDHKQFNGKIIEIIKSNLDVKSKVEDLLVLAADQKEPEIVLMTLHCIEQNCLNKAINTALEQVMDFIKRNQISFKKLKQIKYYGYTLGNGFKIDPICYGDRELITIFLENNLLSSSLEPDTKSIMLKLKSIANQKDLLYQFDFKLKLLPNLQAKKKALFNPQNQSTQVGTKNTKVRTTKSKLTNHENFLNKTRRNINMNCPAVSYTLSDVSYFAPFNVITSDQKQNLKLKVKKHSLNPPNNFFDNTPESNLHPSYGFALYKLAPSRS